MTAWLMSAQAPAALAAQERFQQQRKPLLETTPPMEPRGFLLCVVIGLPGLQDPLDQAALLE